MNHAVVSPIAIYKPGKIPKGDGLQLQISWDLLCGLWAILQLDHCIMSWHGPSLCADSSVTLRDNVKFISAVSLSQLVGCPPLAITRWCLYLLVTGETEFISNSFHRCLISHRGTRGSHKSSKTSLWGLHPQPQVYIYRAV